MKKNSYIGKSRTDLVKALSEKKENLRKFRFGEAGSKTRNTKLGHESRKDIARILTELNKKEVENKK